MKSKWAIPVLASILILGTLGIPHAFAQLCPLTGCLTDNLYVADFDFGTVRQYDSTGFLLDASFVTGLAAPRGIAFDSIGNLYVIDDTFNTVRQYDSTGFLLDASFVTGLFTPQGIAFDSIGNLYIVDDGFNTVRQYDSTGFLLDADFAPGLLNPQYIAIDSTGNLYVTDPTLNTVRQYDSTGFLLDADFAPGLGNPSPIAFDTLQPPVGGTSLPIDTTALLLAGAQSISMWMILGVLSLVGIGLAVFTLKRSR